MEMKVYDRDGVKVLHLRGELGGDEGDLVETFTDILTTPKARIVLDLGEVSYINSAGLSELVRLVGQANVQEACVILVNPSPFVSGVLDTTRLNRFFDISPTVEDAFKNLPQRGD